MRIILFFTHFDSCQLSWRGLYWPKQCYPKDCTEGCQNWEEGWANPCNSRVSPAGVLERSSQLLKAAWWFLWFLGKNSHFNAIWNTFCLCLDLFEKLKATKNRKLSWIIKLSSVFRLHLSYYQAKSKTFLNFRILGMAFQIDLTGFSHSCTNVFKFLFKLLFCTNDS